MAYENNQQPPAMPAPPQEKTEKEPLQKNPPNTMATHKESAPPKKEQERTLYEPEMLIDQYFLEENDVKKKKQEARKLLGMSTTTIKEKKKPFYDRLKIQLYKAGIRQDPVKVIKTIYIIALFFSILVALIIGGSLLATGYNYLKTILITIPSLVILILLFHPLGVLLFNAYLSYRKFQRKLEVEKVLPDFLRLVATNYRSGMPLDKALTKSNRPRFGIFSDEIKLVAKTARVNGDLATALEIFGKKFDSKILERAMNNLVMSIRSGSNVSGLLEEVASNITKMRTMRASMAANVKNYVIFIIVAGVIIAPLMFSMSFVMNDTISDVKGQLTEQQVGDSSGTSGLSIGVGEGGGVKDEDFNTFAILMLLTNSLVSASVISMIKYGNFHQGIKNIPLFLFISILLYLAGRNILSGLLGTIV